MELRTDKLFALIGSTIKNNRKEILESALPANLQALIKQVIPPKSIHRKANEGAELLDYGDDEPYLFDDDDDDDGIDCDESGSDDENNDAEEVQDESAIIAATAEPSRAISSLFNICSDRSINQDAKFLDALHDVFEQNKTSTIFKTHIKKMKVAFYEARRSVKKRITDVSNNTVVE